MPASSSTRGGLEVARRQLLDLPAWAYALLVGALASWAAFLFAPGAVLGYDAIVQVIWGDDLAHLRLPDYDFQSSPTPHPLQILLALVLAPLGDAAPDAFRVVHILSLGALAVAAFEVGRRLFSWPVGLVAAAILATRPYLIELAHRGAADLPALALVMWAGALEVARPRRGGWVFALLILAGLLRPEAWLLAIAYAIWVSYDRPLRERATAAAYALAGPVLWALSDLLVTGDPLWSYNRTEEITGLLGRETGVGNGVKLLPEHLELILGLVPLAVGLAGLAFGLWRLRERAAGPAILAFLGAAAFMGLAVANLSLQPRYLLVVAAALAVFAGVAALGWTAMGTDDPLRPRWQTAGWAVLAVLVLGNALLIDEARDDRQALRGEDRELTDLVTSGAGKSAIASCPGLAVANNRMVPYVARALDVRIETIAVGPAANVAYVAPTGREGSYIGGGVPGEPLAFIPAPEDARPAAGSDAWQISLTC